MLILNTALPLPHILLSALHPFLHLTSISHPFTKSIQSTSMIHPCPPSLHPSFLPLFTPSSHLHLTPSRLRIFYLPFTIFLPIPLYCVSHPPLHCAVSWISNDGSTHFQNWSQSLKALWMTDHFWITWCWGNFFVAWVFDVRDKRRDVERQIQKEKEKKKRHSEIKKKSENFRTFWNSRREIAKRQSDNNV